MLTVFHCSLKANGQLDQVFRRCLKHFCWELNSKIRIIEMFIENVSEFAGFKCLENAFWDLSCISLLDKRDSKTCNVKNFFFLDSCMLYYWKALPPICLLFTITNLSSKNSKWLNVYHCIETDLRPTACNWIHCSHKNGQFILLVSWNLFNTMLVSIKEK